MHALLVSHFALDIHNREKIDGEVRVIGTPRGALPVLLSLSLIQWG